MRTIREMLLARHRAAEPRLDAIRRQVVAVSAAESRRPSRTHEASSTAREGARSLLEGAFWLDLVYSLRWHLAVMAAAWLGILALNAEVPADRPAAAGEHGTVETQRFRLAFRESRRQLQELIETPATPSTPSALPMQPGRRSERMLRQVVA